MKIVREHALDPLTVLMFCLIVGLTGVAVASLALVAFAVGWAGGTFVNWVWLTWEDTKLEGNMMTTAELRLGLALCELDEDDRKVRVEPCPRHAREAHRLMDRMRSRA
jgi:hypothetical protein